MANYTKEDIYNELKSILIDDMELSEEQIKGEANLYEDLDLDSIDAVDIAVRMQRFTEKKLSPEEFKQIRTVDDIVDEAWKLIENND